jgi:hypothetical protein
MPQKNYLFVFSDHFNMPVEQNELVPLFLRPSRQFVPVPSLGPAARSE